MKERLASMLVKIIVIPWFFIMKRINHWDDSTITEEMSLDSDYIRYRSVLGYRR